MDNRTKTLWASLLVVVLLIGLMAFNGCKKKSAPATTALAANPVASMDIIQKTCPVMGNPINKDVFVEYQGKKAYFCCEQCKTTFEKEPEKYIAKLPQFK